MELQRIRQMFNGLVNNYACAAPIQCQAAAGPYIQANRDGSMAGVILLILAGQFIELSLYRGKL
jgi:hypothetical protein